MRELGDKPFMNCISQCSSTLKTSKTHPHPPEPDKHKHRLFVLSLPQAFTIPRRLMSSSRISSQALPAWAKRNCRRLLGRIGIHQLRAVSGFGLGFQLIFMKATGSVGSYLAWPATPFCKGHWMFRKPLEAQAFFPPVWPCTPRNTQVD